MKVDYIRIKRYLNEIKKNSESLKHLIDKDELTPDSIPLKAAKYILIELAEAMSNTIQHILAKKKGVAVSGYIDTIVKAHEHEIITDDLFHCLKPFFDFRNSLIHRYWIIDDNRLIENLKNGSGDFERFLSDIEKYLKQN